jgi:hypothetical protein
MRQFGLECLQDMDANAFIGEQGIADAEHERFCFHRLNLSARYSNNNQEARTTN